MACLKATKLAMERFVQSSAIQPESVRTLAGFSVAGFGIGCYRMGMSHKDALVRALQSGINVVDTSSTYLAGESESMIGEVLSGPLKDRRKEVVTVTKVGYLQGPLMREAAEREAEGRAWPEVVKFHPQAWHCMHPAFIREQLAAARRRLRGAPDIVLLHNPEFFFTGILAGRAGTVGPTKPSEAEEKVFYERLELAFEALEEAADEGHLSSYGISTNPQGCRWSCSGLENRWEATDVARIAAAAHAAARRRGRAHHRCRVLQVPCNLLEPDAFLPSASSTAKTVLEEAIFHELDVMTHRPLNAIPPPGFSMGDWARREAFILLRDRRPMPPALALIASVCRDALARQGRALNAPHDGLSDMCLHTSLSLPVSVALCGARQVEYVDKLLHLLSQGPLPQPATLAIFQEVQHLLENPNAH